MAVHVPLSAEAQAEARILMLSVNNILSPAHGGPVATPTQDMVLGCYYLTFERVGATGEGKCFSSPELAKAAYDAGVVALHARIVVRMPEDKKLLRHDGADPEDTRRIVTTVGKLIFNDVFPKEFPYINSAESSFDERLTSGDFVGRGANVEELLRPPGLRRRKPATKSFLNKLVGVLHRKYGNARTAEILDAIKRLGFHYATVSGTTVGIEDVRIPEEKAGIIAEAERKVEQIEGQYRRGLLLEDEKYNLIIDVWTEARERVQKAMVSHLDPEQLQEAVAVGNEGEFTVEQLNPVYMMAISGARGNVQQLNQLAGMRGLVADPSGRTIDVPIKSNFREGLNVLEYFISTHGTRKGLADTALRTADSGYLTRRLVDVAQDVIVREEDCGTEDGITATALVEGDTVIESLADRVVGRVSLKELVDEGTGEVLLRKNQMIDEDIAAIIDASYKEWPVRSVLKCRTRYGVCASCYGRNLATGQLVEVGEAVGIIAAQSIGEPGTQLTMRTFHTGGVAGDDITRGLPRVEELFEARKPKGRAVMTELDGTVRIEDARGMRKVVVVGDDGEEHEYNVPQGARLAVRDGDRVRAGDRLTEGSLDPHELLRVCGTSAVQQYIVREVQDVYRSQGVEINDKHIEGGRAPDDAQGKVEDPGGTDLFPARAWTYSDTRKHARSEARGTACGQRQAAASGDHQGVAADRQLPVGGVLPGDHQGADGCRHQGQDRPAHRPEGERHHRQADPGRHRHVQVPRHQACGRCRGRRRPGAGHRAFSHGAHAWSRWSSGAGGPACRCCCRRRWRRARCAAENGAFRPTEGRAGAGHAYAGRPGGRERLGSAEAEGAPGAPCYHRHRCEGGGVLPVGRSGEGDEPRGSGASAGCSRSARLCGCSGRSRGAGCDGR